MTPDQKRVRELLKETIRLLCKSGLQFDNDLRIEGVLGITVDSCNVFIVHLDEKIVDSPSPRPEKTKQTSPVDDAQASDHDQNVASSSPLIANNETSTAVDGLLTSAPNCTSIKVENSDEEDDVMIVGCRIKVQGSPRMSSDIFRSHDSTNVADISSRSEHHSARKRKCHSNSLNSTPVCWQTSAEPEFCDIKLNDSDLIGNELNQESSDISVRNDMLMNSEFHWPNGDLSGLYGNGSSYHSDGSLGYISRAVPSHSSWNETRVAMDVGTDMVTTGQELCTPQSSSNGPLNTIASRVIRDALVQHIVQPLICQSSRSSTSFRIVWRHSNAAELEAAWLDIHSRRLTCDTIIRRQPRVDFFFSAIAGLYNKSCSRTVARALGIIPCVSYYVVGEGIDDNLWIGLNEQFPGAQLKPITIRGIQSHSANVDDASFVAAPLYTVLKDYNSRYVLEQLERSLQVVAAGQDASSQNAANNAKLIVVNSAITESVRCGYTAVLDASPSFNLLFDV